MVDPAKHVERWRSGAEEEIAAAQDLLDKGHTRQALFFADLAVEKMLKALVVKATGDLAPRTHDLAGLAERAGLALTDVRRRTLARIREHRLDGRYPEEGPARRSRGETEALLDEARETLSWLRSQL
jgi:HEPN domain-containing protein